MVAEDGGSPPEHPSGDTFESPARSGASTQRGDATGAPEGGMLIQYSLRSVDSVY